MHSVIVQYQPPGQQAHTVVELAPNEELTFGRGAPDRPVGLVIEHEEVSRLAGRIEAADDYWLLSNLSGHATYVVENPEGAGEHVKVPPRRLGASIPFELSRVVLPVRHGAASFVVFAPEHRYADGLAEPVTGGQTTIAPFSLDETAKYFLVLVALCEPRLRDGSPVAVPTDNEVLARLRGLPSCRGLTRSAVNFHIDYLARVKLRLRDPTDNYTTEPEISRRAELVAFALRFNLVREEHLALLPAPPAIDGHAVDGRLTPSPVHSFKPQRGREGMTGDEPCARYGKPC